jgi:hypothetical protein
MHFSGARDFVLNKQKFSSRMDKNLEIPEVVNKFQVLLKKEVRRNDRKYAPPLSVARSS